MPGENIVTSHCCIMRASATPRSPASSPKSVLVAMRSVSSVMSAWTSRSSPSRHSSSMRVGERDHVVAVGVDARLVERGLEEPAVAAVLVAVHVEEPGERATDGAQALGGGAAARAAVLGARAMTSSSG